MVLCNNMKIQYSTLLVVALLSFLIVFVIDANQNNQNVNYDFNKTASVDKQEKKDLNNNINQPNDENNGKEQKLEPIVEEYAKIALAYLIKTPTFAYDGIADTLTLVGYQKMKETQIAYKFRYYSRHPGYGNREGAPIPEQQTLHATIIMVTDGNVTFAGTDNKYDEMTKNYMLFNPEIK